MVPDPQDLYQLTGDLPELGRPVLIQALTGFVDAGSAGRLAREHLLETLPGQVIATFDIDALLDYRSRRPVMLFVEDHWESYEEPTLALHLLHDRSNTPFLLLAGPEPDLYWERFTTAVIGLIDRLGVRLTVGFNSIPMAVPHTRPTGVTAHATRRDLIVGTSRGCGGSRSRGRRPPARVPPRPGRQGRDGIRRPRAALPGPERVPGGGGTAAHRGVQGDRPDAADRSAARGGRDRPGRDRPADRPGRRGRLGGALARAAVRRVPARQEGNSLLAESNGPLPTADELGAELERFLAEQARPDNPPN
jgi:hypothetical protein